MLKEINQIFDKNDRKIIGVSIFFSLIVSVTEVFGITMLFPFMGVVSDPSNIQKNKYLKYFYENIAMSNYKKFIMYFGTGIILVFIFKNIISLAFNYYSTIVARKLNRKYSNRLFKTYLDFEYINYVKKNRSEFIRIVTQECGLLVGIFQNAANLISEATIMLLLYIMMLYVNWKLTLSMTLFLLLNILIIKFIVIKKSKEMGKTREEKSRVFYKIVNSIFSNYKFIKLSGNHSDIQKEYDLALEKNDEIQIKQAILTPIPKSMLEFSGFFMIVSIVLFSIMKYGEDGMAEILPIVSLFFLSLYRMLPSIIRIVGIFQGFAFMSPVPERIKNELSYEKENLGDKKIEFRGKIEIRNLKFQYKEDELILNNISINVGKGESVAFIGESGSGKTTLVDILMGLYKPLSGDIYIDNQKVDKNNLKAWREKIGYIPQEIYLFDGTVAENIVFGSEYNEERIIEVLKKAKIWDFLKGKNGIYTKVGDAGVMLSGGQKQRIGIARALYKDPEILVLDEATSALDDNTEREIMNEMYNLSSGKTLIMIAHRLSSLKRCHRIYELEKGVLKKEYSHIREVKG
ncbi:ABC transporter ATP-binding protein [Cetobacterium somerae]|uniref:ABC transporter ATP-binding protein n=1 Tax=Cetobacterium somerae TaxID=188913 RepID=UPI00211E3D5B|nr:ABC transporter ATP-binding protein [Cetobacterium somerae]MCQ9626452.1 ABC transporter ATP-binding protein [Cetobacterium somerae]